MKKLLQFLRPYKKESVLGPLFKLLEASFELFVPLVVAAIIDVGIAQQDRRLILLNCALLLALAIIGLICAVTAQYFSSPDHPLWIGLMETMFSYMLIAIFPL